MILDKDLWANIETGDKEAYSEAYIFYYKKLFNYGRKITDDIALIEDAIDEVFIMIWTNRKKLRAIISPQAYIFSSFRNNIIKTIKSSRLVSLPGKNTETEVEFSIDSIIIKEEADAEMKHQISQAILQLTDRQREAIFLRFYEGLSYIEIAGVMNISVKATYKIMARALAVLKNSLAIPTILLTILLREFFRG